MFFHYTNQLLLLNKISSVAKSIWCVSKIIFCSAFKFSKGRAVNLFLASKSKSKAITILQQFQKQTAVKYFTQTKSLKICFCVVKTGWCNLRSISSANSNILRGCRTQLSKDIGIAHLPTTSRYING